MKKINIKSFWAVLIALAAMVGVSSCSEELGETIFPDVDETLDKTAYTFALDSFIKREFTEPYNMSFLYRMVDTSTDMSYDLVPTSYEKAAEFAVLCKYLWFDVYKELAGEKIVFLKKYSPRIIHLIGSPAYNQTGTIVQGTAEGGKKVTLYEGNSLDVTNINRLNDKFFHTMHHEFGHVLSSAHLYSNDYRLLSNGLYSPFDWQQTPDSVALGRGFITPYSANMIDDDVVEIVSTYLTEPIEQWNQRLAVAAYDWEKKEGLDADTLNAALLSGVSRDIIGYVVGSTSDVDGNDVQYDVQRKVIARDPEDRPILTDGTVVFFGFAPVDTLEDGTPVDRDDLGFTTRSVADSSYVDCTDRLNFTHAASQTGAEILNQKWNMIRDWLKEFFELDFVALRNEVQRRQYVTETDEQGNDLQNEDGSYVFKRRPDGSYYNRLTYPTGDPEFPTLMDKLMNQINELKKLK